MRNLSSEEVSVFTYEDWLSRTRGPKRTVTCEMAAVVDEEVMVELTTYILQVKTSDNAGRPVTRLHGLIGGLQKDKKSILLEFDGSCSLISNHIGADLG